MPLEYVIALSAIILGIGLIGVMVRREPVIIFSSIVMIAGALLIAFVGFSLFWKNEAGLTALFVILALLIVQILTTLGIVSTKKS